jgi:hypothetical protein
MKKTDHKAIFFGSSSWECIWIGPFRITNRQTESLNERAQIADGQSSIAKDSTMKRP